MFNRAMIAAAVLMLLAGCAGHRNAAAPAADAAAGSGSSTISEAQARRIIEQDGYAGVTTLRQDGAGGWTGSGTANGKPVTITVTSSGSVKAQ